MSFLKEHWWIFVLTAFWLLMNLSMNLSPKILFYMTVDGNNYTCETFKEIITCHRLP